MKTIRSLGALFLALAATLALAGAPPTTQREDAETPTAVDYAHERFQPAYAEGRLVQFEQRGPAPEGVDERDVQILYEIEYPTGWAERLARPLCTYCDHNGDGENAWDYHDHVLADLPSEAQNAAGEVHWHVHHVLPAYTRDATRDAEVTAAYVEKLPAQSSEAVRDLINTTLADGTPIAEVVDTNYVFTAPLSRQ